ncbi:hypothetical protein RDWZM_009410 [Blomia tropicalis]|uniref:Uncharacterized protein n=1 Tax=Blomia tropicalis TaxID=40697 RepID=A0A9Q0M1C7_BLOTA|nr:hypothetical protein RDWZM_009410 [Blomia tropicalis]
MGCLFSLFKLVYVLLASLVFLDHIEYIYRYLEVFKAETFFSNNQFAHTMGMFLGLLFRISGLLSAIKEKIALTTTYGLFLLMILLLMTRIEFIFYLYLGTAIYAFTFVVALKYKRAKERKQRARGNRTRTSQHQRTNIENRIPTQVALDLTNPTTNESISPSAPPYDLISNNNTLQRTNVTGQNELYFNPQHNTPPPSYSDLYETK